MKLNRIKTHWQNVLFEKNKDRSNVFLHKIVSGGKTTYHAQTILVDIFAHPLNALTQESLIKIQKQELELGDILYNCSLENLKKLYFKLSKSDTQLDNQALELKDHIKTYMEIIIPKFNPEKLSSFSMQDEQYHGFVCREVYRAWEDLVPQLSVLEEKELLEQGLKPALSEVKFKGKTNVKI